MSYTSAVLREELSLLPGASLPDGQPSWTIYDPARNLFFQIDWPSFEILLRWGNPAAEIVAAITRETTLSIDLADIEVMEKFLHDNELLVPPAGVSTHWAKTVRARQGNWLLWLLHNYLYFRLPLVKPDRWLSRWQSRVQIFFSAAFLRLTGLLAVFGLLGIYRDWERFSSTLVDMLTWDGLIAYGVTLTAVHVIHELGHAFAAKRFGCRVPSMGIAFLVMWPVAYTDTNEVWKLTQRLQRLLVAAAGIVTELMLAIWATFIWLWLPEGGLKTAAFLVSTTTWIATLAVNASPFMRFDGYFILADALQMPNLHQRAFALARWDLRERLFALGDPRPEHFPPLRHAGLIAFAWATWLYRLVLFLGIAVLVYHFFFKLLGIFLFLVEIAWFLLLPITKELAWWYSQRDRLMRQGRSRTSAGILLAIVLLFFIPWPMPVHTSGLLHPANEQVLYAPSHAQVISLNVGDRRAVQSGQQLITLHSFDLLLRAQQATARQTQLAWDSATAGLGSEERKSWQLLNAQHEGASAELASIDIDSARYAPISILAGEMRDLDPDLRLSDWLSQKELIGRVISTEAPRVVAYIEGEDLSRIAVGDRGLFVADGGAGPNLALKVIDISQDAAHQLNETELASLFGGNLQVREKNGALYPERAIYRISFTAEDSPGSGQHRWRGHVSIVAGWEAPGLRYVRQAISVVRRESGF